MLRRDTGLLAGRNLPLGIQCGDLAISTDNANFLAAIASPPPAPAKNLPTNPPSEIHPYKNLFPLQNFEKYIIGTFPPISYVLDHPAVVGAGVTSLRQPLGAGGKRINPPKIPFYHGNNNSLWPFLLNAPEIMALNGIPNRIAKRNNLIGFLNSNRINYSDIIVSLQRKLSDEGRYTASDNNLFNICINVELICNILTNPNSKFLLFNTASIFGSSGIRFDGTGKIDISRVSSFDLFVRGLQELGYSVEIQIKSGVPATFFSWRSIATLLPNQSHNKIAFDLRIKNPHGNKNNTCENFKQGQQKELTVVVGPFPSASVARQTLDGNLQCIAWRQLNPTCTNVDFLKAIYQGFRNSNWPYLYSMNC